jgi:hypothetical protein
MRTLLPPAPAGSEAAVVGGRLEHLALLAGLEPPTARLRSLEPREVQRYVSSLFDLALDARLLLPRQELQAVLESPPEVWGASERRLAQRLGAEEELLRGEAAEELLLDLSLALGVVRVMEAAYVGQERGRLEVRSGGETRRLPLSPTLATYAARGSQTVAGDLALRPGDRLQLYLRRGDVLALRQSAHRADLFAEDLPYRSWSRFRTAGEVRSAVRERYPGFDLRSFEVTERGVSGRVARLRLLGTHGDELFLEGLQVRWTLGLPDTLFTVRPLSRHEGSEGWLFEGRGWGHGVGLCQVGAFGMAQRGHHYDEILDYYYSGVHLVRVSTPPRVVVAAAGAPKSH